MAKHKVQDGCLEVVNLAAILTQIIFGSNSHS